MLACATPTPINTDPAAVAAIRALGAAEPSTAHDALEIARRAAADYRPTKRMRDLHAAHIAGLKRIATACWSAALCTAIDRAIALKEIEYAKSIEHCRAQEVWGALKGQDARVIKAAHDEIEPREAEWLKAWDDVKAAADAVLAAPFDGPQDMLHRARAYLFLIGDGVKDGEPLAGTEQDEIDALASFKSEVQRKIDERPDREAFDMAQIAYQKHERELANAYAELDHIQAFVERGGRAEDGIEADADAKVTALTDGRDQVADRVLAEEPADLAGLLTFMEVVFDRGFMTDTSTYASRARFTDEGPVDIAALGTEDGQRRALALIASHVARLRERELPSDWRAVMDPAHGIRRLHPNAPDAIMRAYDQGLDPATIANVQLTGRPEKHLPCLTFADATQHWHVTPVAAYEWRPVR